MNTYTTVRPNALSGSVEGAPMPAPSVSASTSELRGTQPFVDIVDFVERTTYAIWNDRRADLIPDCYGPHSVIWGDSGSSFGSAVTTDSQHAQASYPDLMGLIPDTIWTGDDASGYRTSMRWVSRGTNTGPGPQGAPTGRVVHDTCIANCVVLGDQYLEEWTVSDGRFYAEQLGLDLDTAVRLNHRPVAEPGADYRSARDQGATVPAIPERVDGAGEFVVDLLDGLYNHRDLSLVERRYAGGAPYVFGASRWNVGHDGVRSEVARRLDLLPDLTLRVDELYWLDDAPRRSRVAVRYRISGTADVEGTERRISLMGIHHVHVRGDLVVAEWAELDELALHAQLAGVDPGEQAVWERGPVAPVLG